MTEGGAGKGPIIFGHRCRSALIEINNLKELFKLREQHSLANRNFNGAKTKTTGKDRHATSQLGRLTWLADADGRTSSTVVDNVLSSRRPCFSLLPQPRTFN